MKTLHLLSASLLFCIVVSTSYGELARASFSGYLNARYPNDRPAGYEWGGFHYANIHTLMPIEDFGRYFQSGLFHTWYSPNIKGNRDQIGYHKIEGGPGYKPYLRFLSPTTPQKFTMGGVAGGFGSFSNGPGQGSPAFHRGDWDQNRGRYGAAQLSNRILYPLDGVNIENGTENKMFGYGYYALPLTEPKYITAGEQVPTGKHCWTLFFNTENFKGPVAFYTPYHWSKYTLDKPHLQGKTFDNNVMKAGRSFSMETQTTLGKRWIAPNGDKYFRVTPMTLPLDKDGIGRKGTMPMAFTSKKWKQLEAWFTGGPAAPTNFASSPKDVYISKVKGTLKGAGAGWKFVTPDTDGDGPEVREVIQVDTTSYMTRVEDRDKSTYAIKYSGDHIKRFSELGRVQLPEYYKLTKGDKKAKPVDAAAVPDESGLKQLNSKHDYADFFPIEFMKTDPITTPLHPAYKKSGPVIDAWKQPGPTAGPYKTKLSDGSVAVYYWYKFNEQPSILNSDMDEKERGIIQKRVELIHASWSKDDTYFPAPTQPLASIDAGLIVTPPAGLEIGYVPICVHQQLADEAIPQFPKIRAQ